MITARHALLIGAGFSMLLFPHSPVSGQVATLEEGARIRVTAPELGLKKKKGTVVRSDRDTLVLSFSDSRAEFPIPRSDIQALEVSVGKKSAWRFGMVMGAICGGLSFFVAAEHHDPNSSCEAWGISTCDYPPLTAMEKAKWTVGGVLGGAVLGAVTGAPWKVDEWGPVSPQATSDRQRPTVAVRPLIGANRAGLGATISF